MLSVLFVLEPRNHKKIKLQTSNQVTGKMQAIRGFPLCQQFSVLMPCPASLPRRPGRTYEGRRTPFRVHYSCCIGLESPVRRYMLLS